MYSLTNFEVVYHEVLDEEAVALEICDNLLYIGLLNAKVVIFEII